MEAAIELASFIRSAATILTDNERHALINFLSFSPKSGDVIQKTGGLRKLRWGRENKGKRGGVRIIYYHADNDGVIYLLLAYAKSTQADLTAAQLKKLQDLLH